jgi:hypothetical protein
MPYAPYGFKSSEQPEAPAAVQNKSREQLRKAIQDLIKKELTPVDHNAQMSQGKWLFGPQILGNQ